MKKKIGIMLGCLVLTLLVFAGVRHIGYNGSLPGNQPSSTKPSASNRSNATAISSSLDEDTGLVEGYYWKGYLDQREKFQNSAEEKEYQEELMNRPITDAIEDSGYLWYRLDDVYGEIADGSYVKVTYKGPILEVYPAIFSEVVGIEVVD